MPNAPTKLRILVVDDEPLIARALGRVLRHHEVDIASTAEGARRWLHERRYDMVVVDLNLGDTSGEDVLVRADVPLRVLMSGAPPRGALAAKITNGELAWLDKPFTAHRLEQLVACARGRQAA